MELQKPEEKSRLPFNNLYLNAGFVNGFNEWWMYFFGICAAILGYFLFQLVMIFPLISMAVVNGITLNEIQVKPELLFDPEKTGIDKNVLLALLFGMFVFAFLGLLLVIKKIHKKALISVVTAYDKVRWSRIFFGFGIWALLIVITTFIGYFLNPEEFTIQFHPSAFFTLLIVAIVLLPVQTGTEEILFRGYMVQGLSQIFKNGIIPLIITSLLFGAVHMTNPEAKTYGWLIMLPYYSAFGFFLGAITLLDEGLELALGIHCANNLVSSLLVTSPNGVLKTDAILLTAAEHPGAEFVTWALMATITFIIFWQKYRWKNFNLLIQ